MTNYMPSDSYYLFKKGEIKKKKHNNVVFNLLNGYISIN